MPKFAPRPHHVWRGGRGWTAFLSDGSDIGPGVFAIASACVAIAAFLNAGASPYEQRPAATPPRPVARPCGHPARCRPYPRPFRTGAAAPYCDEHMGALQRRPWRPDSQRASQRGAVSATSAPRCWRERPGEGGVGHGNASLFHLHEQTTLAALSMSPEFPTEIGVGAQPDSIGACPTMTWLIPLPARLKRPEC